MDHTKQPVKDVLTLPVEDEPRLAQALVGAFSALSSGFAAAVFTRAALLALHREDATDPAPVNRDVSGSRRMSSALRPGASLDVDLTASVEVLQRLVDKTGVKRFDRRMEASMAKSLEAIFNGTQWMTAAELGRAARPTAANPHSVTSRWRTGGRIYGVEWRGQLLFARYQLDAAFEPLPAMASILATLDKSSPIEIASWFESPNSYLDGKRPRELLAAEPDLVREAAEDSLVGPAHG
jgi:hypothetical protein